MRRGALLLIVCLFTRLTFAEPSVGQDELEKSIAEGVGRVDEFQFIKKEAERLGVRLYLFGGTAASFAHYAKWDQQQKKGDTRFQSGFLNYNFANIFRSTQDIDLVVDGPNEKIATLEAIITKEYPYLMGNKAAWEIRPLRTARGTKEALFGNPDFTNQHSDSNSTGLIEITTPPGSESRIKDLRDWDSRYPKFFEDVRTGKVQFYFSESHTETTRYKNGLNPPIFSVIRFLTKIFQFDAEITKSDMARISKIIREFNSSRDLANAYARDWFERNGKKIFQHASNLEYAKEVVRLTGLEKKIVELGNPSTVDSLAWWASREPLRSDLIGQGNGKTARELGLTELAHDTRSYPIWEAIQRSKEGRPNVFISRSGAAGETAVFGDGFYTLPSRHGAWNSGYSVRFSIDPNAREDADFKIVGSGILILNRNAIRVIPESFQVGPVEMFRALPNLDARDTGLFEKLRRGAIGRLKTMTSHERKELAEVLRDQMVSSSSIPYFKEALEFLKAVPFSNDEVMTILSKANPAHPSYQTVLNHAIFRSQSPNELITTLREISKPKDSEDWKRHLEILRRSIPQLATLNPSLQDLQAFELLGQGGNDHSANLSFKRAMVSAFPNLFREEVPADGHVKEWRDQMKTDSHRSLADRVCLAPLRALAGAGSRLAGKVKFKWLYSKDVLAIVGLSTAAAVFGGVLIYSLIEQERRNEEEKQKSNLQYDMRHQSKIAREGAKPEDREFVEILIASFKNDVHGFNYHFGESMRWLANCKTKGQKDAARKLLTWWYMNRPESSGMLVEFAIKDSHEMNEADAAKYLTHLTEILDITYKSGTSISVGDDLVWRSVRNGFGSGEREKGAARAEQTAAMARNLSAISNAVEFAGAKGRDRYQLALEWTTNKFYPVKFDDYLRSFSFAKDRMKLDMYQSDEFAKKNHLSKDVMKHNDRTKGFYDFASEEMKLPFKIANRFSSARGSEFDSMMGSGPEAFEKRKSYLAAFHHGETLHGTGSEEAYEFADRAFAEKEINIYVNWHRLSYHYAKDQGLDLSGAIEFADRTAARKDISEYLEKHRKKLTELQFNAPKETTFRELFSTAESNLNGK